MSVNKVNEPCQFCEIIKKKHPATILYEDGDIIAFNAEPNYYRVHVLILPKEHIASLRELKSGSFDLASFNGIDAHQEEHLLGKMVVTAIKLARHTGIFETGFRLVINTGEDAIQKIQHLHLHMMGGERMDFEPRIER